MTLKHSRPESWTGKLAKTLRVGLAGSALLAGAGGLTAGCLDRPVEPATPRTSNVYIDQIRQTAVDKIDMLFMIDNSISMADKQEILAQAVPVLVNRLITPICLTDDGQVVARQGGDCPGGSAEEFRAIKDIHIGVVTSSLGSHGGDQCTTDEKDDYAQLLGTRRAGLAQWAGDSGFLVWDPRTPEPGVNVHQPPGETNADTLIMNFGTHVQEAGETGCGYEASLEAWYRFLIDPEPVSSMARDAQQIFSVRGQVNGAVLAQRERFLRSDSLVAIVMLTDENDCSIIDEDMTQGWLVSHTGTSQAPFRMPRASSACVNPNDPCCRLCAQAPANGCPDNAADAECVKGDNMTSTAEDHPNLRCFKQVQRFGVNLLYPPQRYVDGLTQPVIRTRAGMDVPNPLFAPRNGAAGRDPALVFLAGIIGVPWQDIATEDSLNGAGLTYLTAQQLLDQGRWDMILGNPDMGVQPTDPHMWEQIDPRPAGTPHPLLGGGEYAIAGADASGRPNAINGHEQNVVARDDLQYACTFPLATPIDCDPPAAMGNDVGCDCNMSEYEYNRSLCSYPGGATAEGRQEYAKAYPGTRILQVLKGFGNNSIVASICPKNSQEVANPANDPNYGYNPAVGAIITRLKEALNQKCLPRPLVPEEVTNQVPCMVVEAQQGAGNGCAAAGRVALEGERAKITEAVIEHLRNTGQCGSTTGVDCNSFSMCEIQQFSGADLTSCQEGGEPGAGYCYVDRGALVEACKATERRILRFVGENVPAKGSIAVIACLGATLGNDTMTPTDM
jgi:hypothetical protein